MFFFAWKLKGKLIFFKTSLSCDWSWDLVMDARCPPSDLHCSSAPVQVRGMEDTRTQVSPTLSQLREHSSGGSISSGHSPQASESRKQNHHVKNRKQHFHYVLGHFSLDSRMQDTNIYFWVQPRSSSYKCHCKQMENHILKN